MRTFKQLTLADRELLQEMISQGKTQADMASALGKSQSSISRELRRISSTTSSYSPDVAELDYCCSRKRSVRKKRIDDPSILEDVIAGLENNLSPESIAHNQPENKKISTSTIYPFIVA